MSWRESITSLVSKLWDLHFLWSSQEYTTRRFATALTSELQSILNPRWMKLPKSRCTKWFTCCRYNKKLLAYKMPWINSKLLAFQCMFHFPQQIQFHKRQKNFEKFDINHTKLQDFVGQVWLDFHFSSHRYSTKESQVELIEKLLIRIILFWFLSTLENVPHLWHTLINSLMISTRCLKREIEPL